MSRAGGGQGEGEGGVLGFRAGRDPLSARSREGCPVKGALEARGMHVLS